MKTITLEIENEQDYGQILDFVLKMGVKITEQPTQQQANEREIVLTKMKQFYQEKSKNFGGYTFNRDEANER
jgi:ATP-dependent RNA circularization protein (DNA/RNA ligase family)